MVAFLFLPLRTYSRWVGVVVAWPLIEEASISDTSQSARQQRSDGLTVVDHESSITGC
jgi:hypothetical protein